MDAFTYITVLLSIVLGLAITQVLLGFRGLILTRAKVKWYTPTLIWAVIALFVPIQAWWADFTMREHPNWTFFALLVIMLQAISIYMVAALVLPDISGEKVEAYLLANSLVARNDRKPDAPIDQPCAHEVPFKVSL